MNKQAVYSYIGENGIIQSTVYLQGAYSVQSIELTPDEGMILTKDDKNFCYRTIVPESEVKLWHEVEDRGQKNNI